ncbi:MAGUK p55 subfamily member 3-like isoform X2 [Stigmatopora nigra]
MIEPSMPALSANTDLHETLAVLTSHLHPNANHKENMGFLKDVFSEKGLGYLMMIHEKLKLYERHSPTPIFLHASRLADDLSEDLQNGILQEDERELLLLLGAPHLKAVLEAHDTVAQKNFDPVLPPLVNDVDHEQDEESVKIVRLVKNTEPLGATIRREESTGAVVVARIMRGGAADRSGLVHVGDELREVNGNLITHKRPDEISHILSQSKGSITLKIIPAIVEDGKTKESRVYIRALFDYIPLEDRAAPCQEAGLPFKRGDILQVVSQEDATWWQAKKVGDSNMRAALIPSANFQERRLRYRQKTSSLPLCTSPNVIKYQPAPADDVDAQDKGETSFRLQRERQSSPREDFYDFHVYEEVVLYVPRPGDRPRLVVLLGSLGSRTAELKQRMIADMPKIYGLAVPHTSRPRKNYEREGVEYHFITKTHFQADIHNGKFIEHGEYKDNLYGTSLMSIHRTLLQNKICLVDVQPEALKVLRTAAFKPFVVFVRPSLLEAEMKPFGSCSSLLGAGVAEHDLQDMRQSAEELERCYGHLLDHILVKEATPGAAAQLHTVLEHLRLEPQWLPATWMET